MIGQVHMHTVQSVSFIKWLLYQVFACNCMASVFWIAVSLSQASAHYAVLFST